MLLALPRPVTATALLEVPAPEDRRNPVSLAKVRVKAVRRILVRAGLPGADSCFHGYFKFGKSQY